MASSLFPSLLPFNRLASLVGVVELLLLLSSFFNSSAIAAGETSSPDAHLTAIETLCSSTPFPDACLRSLDLDLGVGVNLPYLQQSLQSAIAEATKLSVLLAAAASPRIIEKQRGTLQDCLELQQITLSSLRRSDSLVQSGRRLRDVRTYLSASLTNKNTCLEGLSVASGLLKDTLIEAVISAYKSVSNSLSIASKNSPPTPHDYGRGRRLLAAPTGSDGFPSWLSARDRRLLQGNNGYDPSGVLIVAADGTGNFTKVGDAVAFAPSNSGDRTFIVVKAGIYEENVDIPGSKPNIVLLGDGSDVSIIRGSRSAGQGWTTFRSATVAVSGEGFLARDITFENTAGPSNGQAVALRVSADLVALYHCGVEGYQDTLYTHSFRQFYRECDISGTVDFVFGNAAVALQGCNLRPRKPLTGQFNAITAQGRDDPNMNTGTSIQNCTVEASEELAAAGGQGAVKTYLGRPWKPYSRTVVMQSYIGAAVDPAGWTNWEGDQGLDTLYYGEYANEGPGAPTENRVNWRGYRVMTHNDAVSFTLSELISGDGWLESTSFPYNDGV